MVIEQDLMLSMVDNEAKYTSRKTGYQKKRSTTILEKNILETYLLIPQKYNIKC